MDFADDGSGSHECFIMVLVVLRIGQSLVLISAQGTYVGTKRSIWTLLDCNFEYDGTKTRTTWHIQERLFIHVRDPEYVVSTVELDIEGSHTYVASKISITSPNGNQFLIFFKEV